MYTEIVYLLFFHFRFLKKFWCKTSCLDYLQASPNLMNKFQDSGSLWQLCPMLCIVHRPCCNIGKYVCTIKKILLKIEFLSFMKNFEIWLIISLTVCYLHRLLHTWIHGVLLKREYYQNQSILFWIMYIFIVVVYLELI